MAKRYRNIGSSRLAFPDGQVVEPGDEFERSYDLVQEEQHVIGGMIEEILRPSLAVKRGGKREEVKEDTGE